MDETTAAELPAGGGPPPTRRSLCCREMQLEEFPDKYVIRSLDPDSPDHAFSVSRSDGLLEPISGHSNSDTAKVSTIYGVVGIIRLLAGIKLGSIKHKICLPEPFNLAEFPLVPQ